MKVSAITFAVVVVALMGGKAFAEEIANWAPGPVSPLIDEFIWDGSSLSTGAGTSSSGDGNLQGGSGETSPGLLVSTPFSISGVSSSQQNADGTTQFYDASMSISGFSADGSAGQFGSTLVQPLSGGSFNIFSSSDTDGGAQLLLQGTLSEAVITGVAGEDTGSVLSADITYTGGLIFDAMVAAGGASLTGSLSWALIDIQPDMMIDPETGRLRPFAADGSGNFSAESGPQPGPVIPAPAALPAGLALMAVCGFCRRRRNALMA